MKTNIIVLIVFASVIIAGEWPKTTIDPDPRTEGRQTPEQIETQKNLADQLVIEGVPEDSKTPTKMFDAYFSMMRKHDGSEYRFYTKKALKESLDTEELTPEDLQSISEVDREYEIADLQVVGFEYIHDEVRPAIKYMSAYTEMHDGSRVWRSVEEKLTLIRTPNGWRIDSCDYVGDGPDPDNTEPSPDGEGPTSGGDGTTPGGGGANPGGGE